MSEPIKKKTLKELRLENRYTVKQVSDLSGVPFSTYTAYELGYRKCSMKNAIKIANFYDVKLEEIDFQL